MGEAVLRSYLDEVGGYYQKGTATEHTYRGTLRSLLEKKDRKGRKLSFDDIRHYQRIVAALAETITLMEQINEAIDEHGGWPIE